MPSENAFAAVVDPLTSSTRTSGLPACSRCSRVRMSLRSTGERTVGTRTVRSPVLRSDIRTLEQREHAGRPLVRVDDVSGSTTAANAFSLGIGPSERVVLWNTLLDSRFTHHQVRFVIGH